MLSISSRDQHKTGATQDNRWTG